MTIPLKGEFWILHFIMVNLTLMYPLWWAIWRSSKVPPIAVAAILPACIVRIVEPHELIISQANFSVIWSYWCQPSWWDNQQPNQQHHPQQAASEEELSWQSSIKQNSRLQSPNHHQPWSCETSSLYWFSQSSPAPLQTGKPDIEISWVLPTAVMSCVEFLEYNHHLKFKLICHTSISWILSRSPSASSATFSAIPNW